MKRIKAVHFKQNVPVPQRNGTAQSTKKATTAAGRKIYIEMPFLVIEAGNGPPHGIPLGSVLYVEFEKGKPEKLAGEE